MNSSKKMGLDSVVCLSVCFVVAIFACIKAEAIETKPCVAPTPPMGWDGLDAYDCRINEKESRAHADSAADHLLKYGRESLGHTSGTCNWFDAYDPATGTWTPLPDAPHIRDHFHAVVVNHKLYCIGGRNTSYRNPVNPKQGDFFGAVERAVDVYDFKSGTWSTLEQPLPHGSAAGGTAVIGDTIIYFGGETAEDAINLTQALNTKTGTWSQLAPMKQGRHGSQAVVYKNRIYISAGSPNRGGGRVNSTEMFSYIKDEL